MKLQHFRYFISNFVPTWLEMARGSNTKEKIPLVLPMIRNLLIHVRGGSVGQARVLRWIYTEGLTRASQKRKELAEKATKDLKKKMQEDGYSVSDEIFIPEDKLFSKKIIPSMANRFKIPEDYLSNFLQDVAYEYDVRYEIKYIPNLRSIIDVREYNNSLPSGKQKFKFGGHDGLLEQLEDTDWADEMNRVARDPYMTDDPPRHGIDLGSPAPGVDVGSNQYVYKFDKWTPPISNRPYQTNIDQLIKYAASGSTEDDPDLLNWIQHIRTYGKLHQPSAETKKYTEAGKGRVAELFGYKSQSTQKDFAMGPYQLNDEGWPIWEQRTYDFLKKCFLEGTGEDGYPEEKDHVGDFFNDATKVVKGNRTKQGKGKQKTKGYINVVINTGAKKLSYDIPKVIAEGYDYHLKQSEETEILSSFSHEVDDSKFTYDRQYKEIPVDIEDLKSQGWRWTTQKDETGKMEKGEESISLHKINDQWYAEIPKDILDEEPTIDQKIIDKLLKDGWKWNPNIEGEMKKGKQTRRFIKKHGNWYAIYSGQALKQVPILGVSSVKARRGVAEPNADSTGNYSFANIELDKEAVRYWADNAVSEYGEEALKPNEFNRLQISEKYPPSLVRGAAQAVRLATGQTKLEGKLLQDFLPDVIQKGYPVVFYIINHKLFNYGELDKKIEVKKGEDKGDVYEALPARLAKKGIEDPEKQKEYIDRVREIQNKGGEITRNIFYDLTTQVYEDVLQAFRYNGYIWRKNEIARRLRKGIKKESDQMVFSLQGAGGRSEEGDTQTLDVEKGVTPEEIEAFVARQGKLNRTTAKEVTPVTAEIKPIHVNPNLFINARPAQHKDNDYLTAYDSAHKLAQEYLNDFKGWINREDFDPNPDKDSTHNHEVRDILFGGVRNINTMFNNLAQEIRSDNYKIGYVDGICDTITNDLASHIDQRKTHPIPAKWERYVTYLYYAFFIKNRNGKINDLVTLAKKIILSDKTSVKIMAPFNKAYKLLEDIDAVKHEELNAKALTYAQKEAAERQKAETAPTPAEVPVQKLDYYSTDDLPDMPPVRLEPPPPKPPASKPAAATGTYGGRQVSDDDDDDNPYADHQLISFKEWRKLAEAEVACGAHPPKPKDGCGFNFWGTPGTQGTSITGEVNMKKRKKRS